MSAPESRHDVIVIGAGPAGLAAARRLAERGADDVVVLDRETNGGGIPRHCHHTGYGLREFGRLMNGPNFALRTVAAAVGTGVVLRTGITVTELKPGGRVAVSTPHGPASLSARRVVLATGVRETPRSARLVSGTRPQGVTTTGALQQMIYLARQRPFRKAVIVGSELVSFSALLTMRAGGIRPVAMIEENDRITARRPADAIARTFLGIPVLTSCHLVSIEGGAQVEGVVIERNGRRETIVCDGVVFTGDFRPENALLRSGVLAVDQRGRGPVVDQFGRCSDPAYFACGNLLHPVETAGYCYREGLRTGEIVARDLAGGIAPPERTVPVYLDAALSYLTPQVVAFPTETAPAWAFNGRARYPLNGRLSLSVDGIDTWSKNLRILPERRVRIPAPGSIDTTARKICLEFATKR